MKRTYVFKKLNIHTYGVFETVDKEQYSYQLQADAAFRRMSQLAAEGFKLTYSNTHRNEYRYDKD